MKMASILKNAKYRKLSNTEMTMSQGGKWRLVEVTACDMDGNTQVLMQNGDRYKQNADHT